MYNMNMDITALQTYRQGWQAVEEVEKQEARQATIEMRWLQLNSLVGMAIALEILPLNDREEEEVRTRWNQLKKARNDRT